MEISAKELQEKINNGEKIILEMWAPWCNPCTMIKPVFERVASKNTSDVQMYTMNIDTNKEYAQSLGVRSIPTIKLFSNGKVSDTVVGIMSEDKIKSLINNLITG
jgi:thioredoxin